MKPYMKSAPEKVQNDAREKKEKRRERRGEKKTIRAHVFLYWVLWI